MACTLANRELASASVILDTILVGTEGNTVTKCCMLPLTVTVKACILATL